MTPVDATHGPAELQSSPHAGSMALSQCDAFSFSPVFYWAKKYSTRQPVTRYHNRHHATVNYIAFLFFLITKHNIKDYE